MSENTSLKRFFTNSRVTDSFAGGKAPAGKRRPGARALLAAGVTSLVLLAGMISPAWAQEAEPATGGNDTAVTEIQTNDAVQSSPLASWINLVQENCDSVTTANQGAADTNDSSWSDGIFAKLAQTELGAALQEFAADEGMFVCNNPAAGMVAWSTIGSRTVLSSSPDYTPHPMIGAIGDGGASYTIALQLRLKQQEKVGNSPSPQMNPADALLINRLVRMDAALYMAEMAVDLKYNHGDSELYDAIHLMSRFEGHAILSAGMINTLEEQAKEFQPENVKPGEGEGKPAELTGINLTDGLRRAALDTAAATAAAERFDGAVLNGYEAYLELPARVRANAPPNSVSVSDAELAKIGDRPGDEESGQTYLTGGHDLRSRYYLNTHSVNNAMRLADIIMRLSGDVPHDEIPQPRKDKPRTFEVTSRSL